MPRNSRQHILKRGVVRACWLLVSLFLCAGAGEAAAQPIFDQDPFDRIYLKSDDEEAVKVEQLDLPGRRVPDPFPGGRLVVTLVSKPNQPYEILWSDIDRIELFEQIILQEAVKLLKQKKFDDAFDYFQRLHASYPDTPGLAEATNNYLQQNALQLISERQFDRALAVLDSLFLRQPKAAGLNRAVDRVTNEIIQDHLRRRDLRTARTVLDVVEKQFSALDLESIGQWRGRFRKAADDQIVAGVAAFSSQGLPRR